MTIYIQKKYNKYTMQNSFVEHSSTFGLRTICPIKIMTTQSKNICASRRRLNILLSHLQSSNNFIEKHNISNEKKEGDDNEWKINWQNIIGLVLISQLRGSMYEIKMSKRLIFVEEM